MSRSPARGTRTRTHGQTARSHGCSNGNASATHGNTRPAPGRTAQGHRHTPTTRRNKNPGSRNAKLSIIIIISILLNGYNIITSTCPASQFPRAHSQNPENTRPLDQSTRTQTKKAKHSQGNPGNRPRWG